MRGRVGRILVRTMRLQDILWGCAKAVLNLGKLVVGWSGLLEGGGFSLRMLGDVDWGGLGVGSTPALAELGRGTRSVQGWELRARNFRGRRRRAGWRSGG
jgi:hypothetical protein